MAENLILFTSAYPFGNEEYFLESEIPFLAAHFKEILIIPSKVYGIQRSIPSNVSLDLSYAALYPQNKLLNYLKRGIVSLFSPLFYQYREGSLWHRMAFFSKVETARLWLIKKLDKNPDWKEAVFYTYWFYAEATAISWIKKHRHPHLRWISRAHGFDLLEENYPWKIIPARKLALSEVNTLYCISEHGQAYLKNKYGYHASVAKLGVCSSQPSISPPSIFRIVSCSNVIPLKRVHLTIESIAQFSKERPEASIEWHHFGDGPLKEDLEKLAACLFPQNVFWKFHGQVPNQTVLSFYEKNGCSLFILLSETEGIPVAIMEALAASIPVVATHVGGIAEIVDETCGRLLSSHPSPQEVATAIKELYDSPHLLEKLKEGALHKWNLHHNAEVNYPRFCQEIFK